MTVFGVKICLSPHLFTGIIGPVGLTDERFIMSSPKTVRLYFIEGVASGRVKATLANWTGVAFRIPRTFVDKSDDRAELRQTGVYFLFGTDETTGEDAVYVGQASVRKNGKGVLGRIVEHIGEKKLDYWTHAVILVTVDDSFGPTEISYLENRFHTLATDANRFKVMNRNSPSEGNVTEEKEAELDEFIGYSKLVLGALGYKVFEKPDEDRNVSSDDKLRDHASDQQEPLLYFELAEAKGTGRQVADGFLVYRGSKLAKYPVKSCPEYLLTMRTKYENRINSDLVLTEDILFSSPSAAAGFLRGSSINGQLSWKTSAGLPLSQIEAAEAEL